MAALKELACVALCDTLNDGLLTFICMQLSLVSSTILFECVSRFISFFNPS